MGVAVAIVFLSCLKLRYIYFRLNDVILGSDFRLDRTTFSAVSLDTWSEKGAAVTIVFPSLLQAALLEVTISNFSHPVDRTAFPLSLTVKSLTPKRESSRWNLVFILVYELLSKGGNITGELGTNTPISDASGPVFTQACGTRLRFNIFCWHCARSKLIPRLSTNELDTGDHFFEFGELCNK